MRVPKHLHAALFVVVVAITAAGCSAIDDARGVADTVDEAVELLDTIEQNSAWDTIADGLDNLDSQDAGYLATIRIQAGPADEAGEFTGALSDDMTIDLQVDARGASLARVTRGGVLQDFHIEPTGDRPNVYDVTDGQYLCADDGGLFHDGLASVFEDYALGASGAHLLSVATEVEEDANVAGRDATPYELESRVADALAILETFGNPDLQARLDAAESFALTGDLHLDDETGALLALASDTTNLTGGERTAFRFEITQWGNVPDIPQPAAAEIAQPCTD